MEKPTRSDEMSTIEKRESKADALYSHLTRLESYRNLKFTEAGMARVASILGWIFGLSQFSPDAAEAYGRMLYDRFDYLAADVRCDFCDRLPARQYLLSDDGTIHSFSFSAYLAIHPDAFEQYMIAETSLPTATDEIIHFCRFQKRRTTWREAEERFIRSNNVNPDLARHYVDGQGNHRTVHYRYAYNGAVIFHDELNAEAIKCRADENRIGDERTERLRSRLTEEQMKDRTVRYHDINAWGIHT